MTPITQTFNPAFKIAQIQSGEWAGVVLGNRAGYPSKVKIIYLTIERYPPNVPPVQIHTTPIRVANSSEIAEAFSVLTSYSMNTVNIGTDIISISVRIHAWNTKNLLPGYVVLGHPVISRSDVENSEFADKCKQVTDEEGLFLYGTPAFQVPYEFAERMLGFRLS